MRVILVGAVESSRIALDSLVRLGLPPALVVTLPPHAAHRHSDFTDLTTAAKTAGSKILYSTNINAPDTISAIRANNPDLCLVIGWSQICHAQFRGIARLGNLAFHPAPLPHLRGRSVIPWTLLLDEKKSGSTLFWLDEGMDSGAILLQQMFSVAPDETARSLYAKHIANLSMMLPEAITQIQSGNAHGVPQDPARATFCSKRTPDDGLIDWRDSAASILRLIRAVGDPYPGAFTYRDGDKLYVDAAVLIAESYRFIGVRGQVQCHTEGGFAVRCGDDCCIEVRKWRSPSGKLPRVHSKLGKDSQT